MQWTSAPNIGQAPLPQRARSLGIGLAGGAAAAIERWLEAERNQLPPWIVVGFGAGIAAWFAAPRPDQWLAAVLVALGVALLGFVVIPGRSGRAMGSFAGAFMLGAGLIWWRSGDVAAPRLERPQVAEVRGTVERVETLTAKEQVRLTITPADAALPRRVRLSVDLGKAPAGIAPGTEVKLRARLAPPPPMALPGTYDFARDAWFRGIGAVGRAIGPAEVLRPAEPHGFARARDRLRAHISSRLPGAEGGIAVALATGDQNAVGKDDAEAMRRSGLTHLLSVSGLHIAAVVGAAMLLTLSLLALSRTLALRWNLVLVAAGAGAAAGIFYTLLTGAQVPTVRSCVAAVLVLGGIALGRDALSLRLIATGAALVLLFRPESLAGASFQMSFAAVTAIVALHSAGWARRWFSRRDEGLPARLLRALGAMVATGLAVEVALIPIALFHFHRAGLYGVGANILAIPLTTFVIMPLEGAALLLDLAGIGAPAWWLCGRAIAGLLWLAREVAGASGAVASLAAMPAGAFALMVGGGLWLCLWETPVRRFGFVPVAVGSLWGAAAPRPDLLITGDGRHLALLDERGVPHQLRERSGDYVRTLLAEASGFDGDVADLGQGTMGQCSPDACFADLDRDGRRWRLLAIRSRQLIAWRELVAACAAADIVVADRRLPPACQPRWLKLDRAALEKTGGVSISLGGRTPLIRTVTERVGDHPWAARPPPPRPSTVE